MAASERLGFPALWVPSMLAGAAAVNDVVAATEVISGALVNSTNSAFLTDLLIYTLDDIAPDLDIYLLESDVALGTEDSAPSVTDANAQEIIALIQTGTAYVDLGGVRILHLTEKDFGRIALKSVEADGDIYGAVVTQTAVTFSAAGLVIRFKFLYF